MKLERRSNKALATNPPVVNGQEANIHITTHGSDWYWAATGIFFLLFIIFLGLSHVRRPTSLGVFYRAAAVLTLIPGVAYFTMASDLGFVPIVAEWQRVDGQDDLRRQVFYVRYIMWFVTTAIQMLVLHVLACMPWQTTVWIVLVDWVVVGCGLTGALVSTSYKWGYFAIALVLGGYILAHLAVIVRPKVAVVGTDISRAYHTLLGVLALMWLLYPICWGLSEGGNKIHPDSEAAFYGVLDVLGFGLWSGILVWGTRDVDLVRLGIHIAETEGEKRGNGVHSNEGVTA